MVIADDHRPTRALVRSALEEGGFEVSAEAPDAPSAVAAVRSIRPQVALIDVRMPGGGIEAAAAISQVASSTAVVMLTVSDDEDDLFAALRAGAVGYLLKSMDASALPQTLLRVLAGEAAIPGPLARRLVTEFSRRDRRRVLGSKGARLTNREWEVLEMLADGLTTAEIAARLYVASVTVRTHVAAIVRKLHVEDRHAAARLFRFPGDFAADLPGVSPGGAPDVAPADLVSPAVLDGDI